MSGVLRRGSLNFDYNLNSRNGRGSFEANLDGDYRESTKGNMTPEISVISIDLRRYADDLNKNKPELTAKSESAIITKDLSQDVDGDILSNYLGHYGRWSLIWTFILSIFQIPPSFQLFGFVFQTISKDFWCARPDHLSAMNVSLWRNLTQINNGCSLLNINYTSIISEEHLIEFLGETGQQHEYVKCSSYEFSTESGIFTNLIEEFDLVCDRKHLLSYVEMSYLAGAAIGSISSGWISDRYGRKHTLMIFTLVEIIFGTLIAFSTSLTMFMTLRAIIGFASMTICVVSFVLVVELVSGKWLTIIGILNILPVSISYVLAAGIAYYIRGWRMLQLAFTLPCMILLSIWYCVPESPRWLFANRWLVELYGIIERAAKLNGTQLPANYQKSIEAASIRMKCANSNKQIEDEQNHSCANIDKPIKHINPFVVVFGKLYLRTTCLTLVSWFTLVIIYFGLTLHFSSLGGDIYLNTAIAGVVEGISICSSIFVVLKWGLRRSLIGYMLIPGICCLASYFLPHTNDFSIGVIALGIIAKCLIGANNAIIPTYTAMQYHTTVRNFGVGLGNLSAGIALILVPFLWMLAKYDEFMPMVVMGICGLIGTFALAMMRDVQKTPNL